jgi:hypothetical protein
MSAQEKPSAWLCVVHCDNLEGGVLPASLKGERSKSQISQRSFALSWRPKAMAAIGRLENRGRPLHRHPHAPQAADRSMRAAAQSQPGDLPRCRGRFSELYRELSGQAKSSETSSLMAERKILPDAVHVRAPEELRVPEPPPAFGILALQQVPPARAAVDDLPGARNLEPFAHRLSSLNSFGSTHTILILSSRALP